MVFNWWDSGFQIDIEDGDDTVYENVTYTGYMYETQADGDICHVSTHYYTWRYVDGELVNSTYHGVFHDCD